MSYAHTLTQARASAGWSVAELSERSGVPKAQIKRLEDGYDPFTPLETVLLSSELGVELESSCFENWIATLAARTTISPMMAGAPTLS